MRKTSPITVTGDDRTEREHDEVLEDEDLEECICREEDVAFAPHDPSCPRFSQRIPKGPMTKEDQARW